MAAAVVAMGEVYRARDTRLDRTVAVKVLAPELASDAEFRARFASEAKTISALNHPHICGLYDIGRDHGGVLPCGSHIERTAAKHSVCRFGAFNRALPDSVRLCFRTSHQRFSRRTGELTVPRCPPSGTHSLVVRTLGREPLPRHGTHGTE